MPRVPVAETRVNIAEVSGEKFRAPDMRGTGLEAVGRGMESLGEAGAQFAVSADQRQDNIDKLYARNLALEYGSMVKPIVGEYTNLEGANAVSSWQDTQAKVDDAAKAILQRASNPRMRSYAQQLITEKKAEFSDSIVGHSQKQQRVMSDTTYTAERTSAISDYATYALSDPAKAEQRLADARGANDRLAALHGWQGPETSLQWQGQVDAAHGAVIDAAMATDNVDAASSYYEKHQGEMSVGSRNKVLSALRKPLEAREDNADLPGLFSGPAPKGSPGTTVVEPHRIEAGVYHAPVIGQVTNTFAQHQARGSAGLDIAAAAGSAIHPIAGGVVQAVGNDARSGNFVVIKHADGHTSSYSHMAQVSVKQGDPVEGAAVLGTVGMTGHTTGPHVHLRTKDASGKDVDPQFLLGTKSAGGTANANAVVGSVDAPRRYDKASAYAAIDARSDWTPEKKERMRTAVDRRVAASDQLLDRVQDDAQDAAYTVVAGLKDGFTNLSQIPANVRANLKPTALITLQNMAEANVKAAQTGTAPKANGAAAMTLGQMRYYEPERFKSLNMGQFVGQMTPAEIDTFAQEQARMRTAKPTDWSPRSGIVTAVGYGETVGAMKLKPDEKAAVMQIMEAEANALYAAKKQPLTDLDYAGLFKSATRGVATRGVLWGTGQIPRYKLGEGNIPDTAKARITSAFKRERGRDPTDEELTQLFRLQAR